MAERQRKWLQGTTTAQQRLDKRDLSTFCSSKPHACFCCHGWVGDVGQWCVWSHNAGWHRGLIARRWQGAIKQRRHNLISRRRTWRGQRWDLAQFRQGTLEQNTEKRTEDAATTGIFSNVLSSVNVTFFNLFYVTGGLLSKMGYRSFLIGESTVEKYNTTLKILNTIWCFKSENPVISIRICATRSFAYVRKCSLCSAGSRIFATLVWIKWLLCELCIIRHFQGCNNIQSELRNHDTPPCWLCPALGHWWGWPHFTLRLKTNLSSLIFDWTEIRGVMVHIFVPWIFGTCHDEYSVVA